MENLQLTEVTNPPGHTVLLWPITLHFRVTPYTCDHTLHLPSYCVKVQVMIMLLNPIPVILSQLLLVIQVVRFLSYWWWDLSNNVTVIICREEVLSGTGGHILVIRVLMKAPHGPAHYLSTPGDAHLSTHSHSCLPPYAFFTSQIYYCKEIRDYWY